jgi:hypothetical protein
MNIFKSFARQLCFAPAALILCHTPLCAQYVFTTIDDPVANAASGTTYVTGISGNTIVGYYFGPLLHSFYSTLGTTNFTTLDVPLGFTNGSSSTQAFGISGANIVGNYQNYIGGAAGYYGFLYNIPTATFSTLDDPSAVFQGNSRTYPTAIDGSNIVGYVDVNESIYLTYTGGFEAQSTGASLVYEPSFYYPTIYRIVNNGGYNITNYDTVINGISGSNAVGYYLDQNAVYHGIIYNLVSGVYTALNSPSGGGCPLTGIDGNNVVGYYADPNHSFNYSGFVYNLTTGTYTATSLRDPLAPGNTFLEAISGNTLVGHYLDNNGVTHGFVASFPIPKQDFIVIGNNLVVHATNGIPGATCYVINTADLSLPRSRWSVMSTNKFDSNGALSYTNLIAPAASARFFGLSETP